jgi:MYXO-CTERM domain-containing protein
MEQANDGVITALNSGARAGVNMRLMIVFCLLASASLYAQDSEDLIGSVPSNRRITYLYDIDFGGTAQAWTLNVSLNTNASSGLAITLIDVDALAASAQSNPTSINSGVVTAPGTASATLNGSYSGVHCFAVEIETAQGTTASDYDGTITSNVGVITLEDQDQFILTATGLKTAVRKFAFWDGTVQPGATTALSLELNFGSSSSTQFFRLEGLGTNIEKIEFIDTTGGTGVVLATFNNPTSGTITSVPMTHSGKATMRINVKAIPTGIGTASWAVNAPCAVTLKRVGVDENGAESKGCSTGESSGNWLAVLGALAALTVFARRRLAA